MYKLLIVDDDHMIRNGIKNAIQWHKHDIEEVETAENGEDGADKFNSFLPDIVLTDIRMPGIDGLELLQQIKSIKPSAKVIILSGFDDFSYAQTALKLGAFDYLLKTADVNELLKVICNAVHELDNEKEELENSQKLRQQLNMSLPLLKYRYMNELIFGVTDIDSLKTRMDFVDICIKGDCFMAAVAEIDDFSLISGKMTEEERLFIKFKVINTFEDIMGSTGICFESKFEEFVCIYFCEDSLSIEENKQKLISSCEKISSEIQSKINITLSIGVSNIGYSLASVRNCYEDAKKALEHKLFSGKGSIIDIRDIACYTNDSFKLDPDVENRLVSSLRVGEKMVSVKIIEDIFEQIRHRKSLGIGNFQKVCIELLSVASRILYEFDIESKEVFGSQLFYFDEIKKYKDINDAKAWIVSIFEKLEDYILNTKILKARKIIETAKQYIDRHYTEEISLNRISEVVYMSPNYFSSIFSNEVGQSFLEYLTAKRIEKAKQLLGEKDSRAFEVGEKVGYQNPNYFSRVFKKYTGMSPSEYKESVI